MLYGRGALKPQKSTNALTSPEKVTRAKSDLLIFLSTSIRAPRKELALPRAELLYAHDVSV